jgi:hypothetical protein
MPERDEVIRKLKGQAEPHRNVIEKNLQTLEERRQRAVEEAAARKIRAEAFQAVANSCVDEANGTLHGILDQRVFPDGEDLVKKIKPQRVENVDDLRMGTTASCIMEISKTPDCAAGSIQLLCTPHLDPLRDMTVSVQVHLAGNAQPAKTKALPLDNNVEEVKKEAIIQWVRCALVEACEEYLRIRAEGFR